MIHSFKSIQQQTHCSFHIAVNFAENQQPLTAFDSTTSTGGSNGPWPPRTTDFLFGKNIFRTSWPTPQQWWKYKFVGPGTIKTPRRGPLFCLGPLTDFRGPTLISVTYYRKCIRVRCMVMFSALGRGMDLNQAFRWKFWYFGAPERLFKGFWGPPERRSGLLSPLLLRLW